VPSARRGGGEPGSARRTGGDSPGPAGAFAAGQTLDVAPGGGALHGLAEHTAGPGDRFAGASDDELTGIICALDRAEAAASALKHAAVAEFIRRRPKPGCPLEGSAQMPGTYDEFAEDKLRDALAETGDGAARILGLAHDLEVKLPGTRAAFRVGTLRHSKAEIIARATANLDPAEARAAEALVLDRAGPGSDQPGSDQPGSGGENGENGGPGAPRGDGPKGPGDGGAAQPDPGEPGIPPTASVLPAGLLPTCRWPG
jgi:hypothetical protein